MKKHIVVKAQKRKRRNKRKYGRRMDSISYKREETVGQIKELRLRGGKPTRKLRRLWEKILGRGK